MLNLFENDLYRIYWYDEARTILIVEVLGRWTWDDAFTIVTHGNAVLKQVSHKKFSICHLIGEAAQLPIDKLSAISKIQALVEIDPSEEEIAFLSGISNYYGA